MTSGAVNYCDNCRRIITPSEEQSGQAVIMPGYALCAECSAKVRPKAQAAQPATPGRPAASRRVRNSRACAPDPATSSNRSAWKLLLFIILGGLCAAFLIVMFGGREDAPAQVRHPSTSMPLQHAQTGHAAPALRPPEPRQPSIPPVEAHSRPRLHEPQPAERVAITTVLIQYAGDDNYHNDFLPGSYSRGPVYDTMLMTGQSRDSGARNFDELQIALNYRHSKGGTIVAAIRFQLPAVASESVVSASLEIYGWNDNSVSGMRIAAYPLLKSWNQTSNGACFDRREDNTPWNPGATPSSFNLDPETTADFDPRRGVVFAGARRDQWHKFDVTSIVKSWLDGSLENNGVIIMSLTPSSILRCRSSNYFDVSAMDKGVSFRPKLVIQHR